MDPRTSAQDVMRCDLCETAVVQMHCDTCLVNLCKACVGEHISTDETKDHRVVKYQSRKTTPLYPRCISHDNEQCEMYCRHCDIPVCHTCLASDNHLGHKLSKVLHVLCEKKDLIRKEQSELNETIYPTYQSIASDVQNSMSHLKNKYEDIMSAITKHGQDWHREIGKLVRKLKTNVNDMKTLQLQTLQKHLDEINKKIVDIKDEIDSMDIVANSNDISEQFNVKSSLDQYKNLPQKLELPVPKFTPGQIHGEEFCKLFGILSSTPVKTGNHEHSMRKNKKSPEIKSSSYNYHNSPEIRSKPPVKKLLEKPRIDEKYFSRTGCSVDFYSRFPANVACLRNEKIWTIASSSTIRLFHVGQDSCLKTIGGGIRSRNIAVSRSGELIFTDYSERTVNIVKNEDIEEVIRLQKWRPQGVCSTSKGNLLVAMESEDDNKKVVLFSDLIEKQSIQFDDRGIPLYSSDGSHKFICENRNHDICVADCGAKAVVVVVVNQAGKIRFRYARHTSPLESAHFSPRGITTDSQGHILISDSNNYCIHIINEDGEFLRYINFAKNFKLCGLCTDADDSLFLLRYRVLHRGDTDSHVKKIEYLH